MLDNTASQGMLLGEAVSVEEHCESAMKNCKGGHAFARHDEKIEPRFLDLRSRNFWEGNGQIIR